MSYFYLTPTNGKVPLHVLEECVYQRLSYLQKLGNERDANFCEFLLEGSPLDNAGHFMLGLLARISDCPPLLDFVNRAEVRLFYDRINSAESNNIRLLSKIILKTIRLAESHSQKDTYINIIILLCRKLVIKHTAEHIFSKQHYVHCNAYHVDVNFKFCLPLVAKRSITLHKGVAHIPCSLWKYFFSLLFKVHLNSKFTSIQKSSLNLDPRWREIIYKLVKATPSNDYKHVTSLKYDNIDTESNVFPLCMKNLHQILRCKHRLTHNERFRYSLFLKDIGLPIQQAIYFWQYEYSKPCDGKSACTHTWLKDRKKFIYGIRHLYGLEGARKNYCMSKCRDIQSKASSEGGCAFKHFDQQHLAKIADDEVLNSDAWNQIIMKKTMGKYNEACSMYRNAVFNKFNGVNLPIEGSNDLYSPVNYYYSMNILNSS